MSYPFQILDVFAEQRYCGNQLAVFSAAERIPEELLQKFARETNYAETTFAYTGEVAPATYRVRIFTPHEELPFAGHPTLGTAWTLRQGRPQVTLRLGVGDIPVTFDDQSGLAWMRQRAPEFGSLAAPSEAAALLGLREEDLDPHFPAQVVSTGLAFLLVPLRGLEAVRRAAIDRRVEAELVPRLGGRFTFLFSRETYSPEHQVNARMFAETTGVPEDPATGSANGCLAAWMVHHRYLGSQQVEARVEQGYEIKRPSLLYLRADPGQINVGGRVLPTATGEFLP